MGYEAALRVNVTPEEQQFAPALDPEDFPGFSYLLGPPQPWQRSHWASGPDPSRGVLARLVHALPEAADWPCPLKPGVGLDDNPFIPSGYTYLMQFVAHDLLLTDTPVPQAAVQGTGSADKCSQGMMLETLYGDGPPACPAAFEPSSASDARAAGALAKLPPGRPANRCATRPLPHKASHRGTEAAEQSGGRAARTADPRHDDDPMLAHLVRLFSLAHDIIAHHVQPVRPAARFAYARAVMLPIYHSIVRCDLLPRLLHPAVWRALNERSAAHGAWLWQQPGLPLEFSHSAVRASRAMVRPVHVLNDRQGQQDIARIVRRDSHVADESRMPPEADWIAQWSRFFTLDDAPSYSRRISPTRSSLDFRDLLPAADPGVPDAVTFCDLSSTAEAGPWSVDAMIAAIMERAPALIPMGWTFATRARRGSVIAQWLTKTRCLTNVLTDEDVTLLADDPPLPLFILLEAGLDPILRGRCLGVLGSVIVGEVMFKRMAMERDRLEMLRTAAQTALPAELAAAVADVDSMPGLVQFVARFGGMDTRAEMPFG